MHWKIQSTGYKLLSALPSDAPHYWLQRRAGSLRHPKPLPRLQTAVTAWQHLRTLGQDPIGATFLEVGTGWVPLVPLALWLCGAGETITMDLHRYLRPELLREALDYLRAHRAQAEQALGPFLISSRWSALLSASRSAEALLDLCRIRYLAPADAAHTGLPASSVDYQVSFRVLEHIPANDIAAILREGNRVVRPAGLFLHRIDYSDHYSHQDPRLSPVHFLQFSDADWQRYTNRYAYVNRLRHDDMRQLFLAAGHRVLLDQPEISARAMQVLQSGFPLDARFRAKPLDVLATRGAWIATQGATPCPLEP